MDVFRDDDSQCGQSDEIEGQTGKRKPETSKLRSENQGFRQKPWE